MLQNSNIDEVIILYRSLALCIFHNQMIDTEPSVATISDRTNLSKSESAKHIREIDYFVVNITMN